MSITAKFIAKQLNLSAAAVSMALNNKPGVSTETKKRILETAKALGYDFTKIKHTTNNCNIINFILYNKNGIFDIPFFTELISGVENGFKNTNYKLIVNHINDDDNIPDKLSEILLNGCKGIILLGTEMSKEDFFYFQSFEIPIILLDSYFTSSKIDCIQINNRDGAKLATTHLIKKRHSQPGYLRSSCRLSNFDERADGFFSAIRQNGLSVSKSIVHYLSPTVDAAYSDMINLLNQNEEIATCYFADNDEIAIGAMKAFIEKGYKIPKDISIIGFDNIQFSSYISPPLTTINVPKSYIGKLASERMMSIINGTEFHPIKIEVNTTLIIRDSV